MATKPFANKTACDILAELLEARLAMATGKMPKSIRYRSDTGAEQQLDSATMTLAGLNQMINEYRPKCDALNGVASTGRRCFKAGL
jgi:hypothetical protein